MSKEGKKSWNCVIAIIFSFDNKIMAFVLFPEFRGKLMIETLAKDLELLIVESYIKTLENILNLDVDTALCWSICVF